ARSIFAEEQALDTRLMLSKARSRSTPSTSPLPWPTPSHSYSSSPTSLPAFPPSTRNQHRLQPPRQPKNIPQHPQPAANAADAALPTPPGSASASPAGATALDTEPSEPIPVSLGRAATFATAPTIDGLDLASLPFPSSSTAGPLLQAPSSTLTVVPSESVQSHHPITSLVVSSKAPVATPANIGHMPSAATTASTPATTGAHQISSGVSSRLMPFRQTTRNDAKPGFLRFRNLHQPGRSASGPRAPVPLQPPPSPPAPPPSVANEELPQVGAAAIDSDGPDDFEAPAMFNTLGGPLGNDADVDEGYMGEGFAVDESADDFDGV
ncbi:hypothetical protein HK405_015637, partial [Cladochytrium tenue]